MQKITHKQVMFVCDFFFYPVLWHSALAYARGSRGVLFFFVFYELSRLT